MFFTIGGDKEHLISVMNGDTGAVGQYSMQQLIEKKKKGANIQGVSDSDVVCDWYSKYIVGDYLLGVEIGVRDNVWCGSLVLTVNDLHRGMLSLNCGIPQTAYNNDRRVDFWKCFQEVSVLMSCGVFKNVKCFYGYASGENVDMALRNALMKNHNIVCVDELARRQANGCLAIYMAYSRKEG